MAISFFDYTAPDHLLTDHVILVTGANRGIGKAAALSYAKLGATVLLLGRNTEQLATTYDEISSISNNTPAILPFDLQTANQQNTEALADLIQSEYGKLDGLLNNAGVLGFKGMLRDTEERQWQQTLQVNVTAGFLLTKALIPVLQNAEHASVIFTSSSVGRKGRAFWGAYAISKFATEGMMQVFADEMENISNIRFNCINPGGTRTLMRQAAYPAENREQNPEPPDIMPVYNYLMGCDSLHINGQSLDAQHRNKPKI